ncbi:cysteine rich repeat-containing protein [Rhodobium gokarnense]|uniref:Cysteine rich repeat-containing protein n=1 Tax=Rhodobium gokarnense TaxID=364296 RepID=A0ABT3HGQ9_9HYPH|nr:cysteine rich repeat-containing protein [Rhodobium gokarnense]MCW2309596.1 hypothetical protein [Rhodobium gokarnense]
MFSIRMPLSAVFAPAILTLALAAAPAGAEDADTPGVWEACEADVAEYCGEVEPGNGHILSCLYAHETVLSEDCDAAFADFGDAIDGFFFTVRSALATCATDLEEHCSGVNFGKGRLLTCLGAAHDDLEPECEAIVTDINTFLGEDAE